MSKKQNKPVIAPQFVPIKLNGFTLTEKGVHVTGRPSLPQYQGTFDFVTRVKKFAGFWLVDLIRYADSRSDWKDKIDQIIDAEVLTEKSVKQYRYLGKHMLDTDDRVEGVDFGNHAVVAAMPRDEQTKWLEKAKSHNWTQQELRDNVRAAERTKMIDGQAKLAGMYRVIYADPPWAYDNRGDIKVGKSSAYKRAEAHYPTMTIEEMCKLPVAAHAMPDSILFCWVTGPVLLQNPGPREVIESWGFTPKNQFIWDKVLGNFGHYNHVTHEILVVATRGSCLPDVPTPQPKSVQTIRRSNVHSEKPEEFRRLIQTHWNRGPYLELFGRKRVANWDVFGNDSRLWTREDPPIAVSDTDVPF